MLRGEIWWASLPAARGSDPAYRRPVAIIQADAFTRSRIRTVLVAVVTSNLHLADAPGNFRVSARSSGLPKDSVVNVSQVVTVDKRFLTERAGELSSKHMQRLDEGLRLVLSL